MGAESVLLRGVGQELCVNGELRGPGNRKTDPEDD
jgi:hypothetical protein